MVMYECPTNGLPRLPSKPPPKLPSNYFPELVLSPGNSYYAEPHIPSEPKKETKECTYRSFVCLMVMLYLCLSFILIFAAITGMFLIFNPWPMSHGTPHMDIPSIPLLTTRKFKIYNKCTYTVWAGILGPDTPADGGFRLKSEETRSFPVSDSWKVGKIWARTECDALMNCATGWCKNSEQCNGSGYIAPVTLAQFSLREPDGLDYYAVSLLEGFNVPILIDPIGGEGDCRRAGGCEKDLNAQCPQELVVTNENRTVACKSGCLFYNNDRECCRGEFGSAEKCPPTSAARVFKDACPGAYSYALDGVDATYTCRDAHYVVQFC